MSNAQKSKSLSELIFQAKCITKYNQPTNQNVAWETGGEPHSQEITKKKTINKFNV